MAIPGETHEQPFEDSEVKELEEQDRLVGQYGNELNKIDTELEEKKAEDRKIAKKAMETMNPDEIAEQKEKLEEKRVAEEEKSA